MIGYILNGNVIKTLNHSKYTKREISTICDEERKNVEAKFQDLCLKLIQYNHLSQDTHTIQPLESGHSYSPSNSRQKLSLMNHRRLKCRW